MSDYGFTHGMLWISTEVVTELFVCYMAGAMWNCCHFSASFVDTSLTIQTCNSLQIHFIWSHIPRVHMCLAVTCCQHFWQNDQDILHATAITQGWNGYQNKNQHRKLTLEKKNLLLLLPGLKPETSWSWICCSNHWATPASQLGTIADRRRVT